MTTDELKIFIKKFRSEVEDLVTKLITRNYFKNSLPYDDEYTVNIDDGVPFANTAEVLAAIPLAYRKAYSVVVNIMGVEYWFLPDGSLVPKYEAMVIADGSVTLAKQANVASGTVFYRKTAGIGAPEVQTLATLRTDLAIPEQISDVLKVDKVTGYSLFENAKLPLVKEYGDVYGPAISVDNCVVVYDGVTGKLIKLTNVTIDANGRMAINASGVGLTSRSSDSVGIEGEGIGINGFGLSGKSDHVPAQLCNTSVATTGKRIGMVLRGNSANIIVDNGFAITEEIKVPVLGWNPLNPELSETTGLRETMVLTDKTQNSECTQWELELLKHGVLTKVAQIDHDGNLQMLGGVNRNIFTLGLISAASGSLSLRLAGAITYGAGSDAFVLTNNSESPNHLIVTHNLNRKIVDVKVLSVETSGIIGERIIIGPAAYVGFVAISANVLRIENIATVEKAIVIHLIFA